jgi:hypothetical protein
MKYEKKFRHEEQQQQHVSESQLQSQQTIQEFATPEDLLRFDAKQNPAPDVIAQRLSQSVKNAPKLSRPWWKRLFS